MTATMGGDEPMVMIMMQMYFYNDYLVKALIFKSYSYYINLAGGM